MIVFWETTVSWHWRTLFQWNFKSAVGNTRWGYETGEWRMGSKFDRLLVRDKVGGNRLFYIEEELNVLWFSLRTHKHAGFARNEHQRRDNELKWLEAIGQRTSLEQIYVNLWK